MNALCAERGLYHITDEVYEYFTYESAPHTSAGSAPGAAAHTISIYSFSKAYGFASWRIGYMVVPEALATAVNKIQDTMLICAPHISQAAAIGALRAGRAYCDRHVATLAQRPGARAGTTVGRRRFLRRADRGRGVLLPACGSTRRWTR